MTSLLFCLLLISAFGDESARTVPAGRLPGAAGETRGTALSDVRRVFVDRLNGGETAGQIRDMIIASLQNTKLFVITENQDRADAVLRGSAEDLVYNDTFTASEGIDVRATASTSTGSSSSKNHKGAYTSAGGGDRESIHISERRHEASAAVRLVDKNGDVIWSTIQESLGGKFRGASADVADRITRQLATDYQRAQREPETPSSRLP